MTLKNFILALAASAALCSGALAGEPKWFLAPELQQAPDLELGLDDPAWSKALAIPFKKLDDAPGDTKSFPVESRWLRCGGSLYVGFKCFNPDSPAEFAKPGQPRDNALLFRKEGVELFVGDLDGDLYYQFVSDYAGNVFDGKRMDSKWDGPFKWRVKAFKGYWTLVVEVPEPVLSTIWKPGSFISVSVVRRGVDANGVIERVSFSQPAAHNPTERFALGSWNPAEFGAKVSAGAEAFKADFSKVELPASVKAKLSALGSFSSECSSAGDVSLEKYQDFYKRYTAARQSLRDLERDMALGFIFDKKG